MGLQLTGRFNLLSCIADEAGLKNKGVEQVRNDYIWCNTEAVPIVRKQLVERGLRPEYWLFRKNNNIYYKVSLEQ